MLAPESLNRRDAVRDHGFLKIGFRGRVGVAGSYGHSIGVYVGRDLCAFFDPAARLTRESDGGAFAADLATHLIDEAPDMLPDAYSLLSLLVFG